MTDEAVVDGRRADHVFHFDRHTPQYRDRFQAITSEMHQRCPLAWTDTYGGHWVAAGNREVFELARCPHVSNDNDLSGERNGYIGINIPRGGVSTEFRAGMLEMDEPEHREYRTPLNAYLSPAAVHRWVPVVDEIVKACLDEKIEDGRIDFVDDLANIVPAVLTLGLLGVPLKDWEIYCEPAHAMVYTPAHSPDYQRVADLSIASAMGMMRHVAEIRETPRPGLIDALVRCRINGEPAPDTEILGMLLLLIGGGFDTTTALTAHSLEWLSQHPDERERLSRDRDTLLNPATEEFLRYFTPAPGDGRTIAEDVEVDGVVLKEGERLWLSWAMANRDPELFENPDRRHPGPDRQPPLQFWARHPPMHRLQRRQNGFQVDAHRRPGPDARLSLRSRRGRALPDDRRHPRNAAPAGRLHPGATTRPGSGRDSGEAAAHLRRARTRRAHHRPQGRRGHRLAGGRDRGAHLVGNGCAAFWDNRP